VPELVHHHVEEVDLPRGRVAVESEGDKPATTAEGLPNE